ncbi:MAG TPA: ATP-binding protein [Candidatus Obscuribacterales bacterium]
MNSVESLIEIQENYTLRSVLVVEDKKGKRIINLDKNIYSLGRDSKNSIVINSRLVSRYHATLLRILNLENNTYLFQIIDGDLQGNHSTNGLIINGKHCLSQPLQHNDSIIFGGTAQARYLVVDSNLSDPAILQYCEAEDSLTGSSAAFDPFKTLVPEALQIKPLSEAALLRLASFPELLPSPIIEIDLGGKITYLNSAALIQFPDIQKANLRHPILYGLVDKVQNEQKEVFSREVEIDKTIFEQWVYYITESRLIRSYLVNITDRKQKELELQQHQENLQQLVEERTASLTATNKRLQQEIIERQQAESMLRQQALAFQNIYDGIIITDLQDQIVDWNGGAERMFGYSKEEILGKTPTVLHRAEESALLRQEIIDGINQNGSWVGEIHFIHKNGTEGVCETRVIPLYNEFGERIANIGVNHDITHRKQAETEIRKALEKEKELNELRSNFITMASHQFRTPLAIILTSSDILKSYGSKLSEEKKLSHLDRIQLQINNMTQLLEDVLFIGKAESGRIEFNPITINLELFCKEFLEELELTVNEKHSFNFECYGNCSNIQMDEKLLRQMLTNLLSNAIKYSPNGGEISLNLICENEQAIFLIKDEGIGILPGEKQLLFEVFNRGSNVGNIPGTGLGLAIVKKAVELHGGSMAIESQLGAGTTFRVSVPKRQLECKISWG